MRRPLALLPVYSHVDYRLLGAIRQVGIRYLEIHGCSDLVRARSSLLSDALKTDADCFIFIDADMVPRAEDIIQLVESPKLDENNAVAGCYLSRPGRIAVQAEAESIELFGARRFVPMLVGGMGFAATHRVSVEKVRDDLPMLEDDDRRSWYPFFLPAVVQQEVGGAALHAYLPEDFAFWWRLRASGVNLWGDTHLVVGHAKQDVWRPSAAGGKNYSMNGSAGAALAAEEGAVPEAS